MKLALKHICSITFLLTSLVLTAQTFQDNANEEILGDFPSQWEVVNGMALIDQSDGHKFISLMRGGIIKPIVNNQTNNYLSSDFTIEFDLFFDTASSLYTQTFYLRLWDGAYGYKNGSIRYKPFVLYRDGLETDWNQPEVGNTKIHLKNFESLEAVWRHVKVVKKDGKLKLFMDDELLLHLPNFKMQPTMVSIGGQSKDSRTKANIGFTNFTIISQGSKEVIVMLVDENTGDILDINLLENIKKETNLSSTYPNASAYLGNISGLYYVRPVDVADVKKPNVHSNTIHNETVRPVDVADVKKPLNIDLNTYNKYSLQPDVDAQIEINFENKFNVENLQSLQTKPLSQSHHSWSGSYFQSNDSLTFDSFQLVSENGTLKVKANKN